MPTTAELLTAARAEALFLSHFPTGSDPTPQQITAACRRAVQIYGGTRGCAAEAVVRYYDCPEIGVPRMRWARHAVETAYATTLTRPGTAALPLTPSLGKAA
jgi:hypothetical protein